MPTTARRAPTTIRDIRDNNGNDINSSNGGVVTVEEANAQQHQ
jgi:hypothetical protein